MTMIWLKKEKKNGTTPLTEIKQQACYHSCFCTLTIHHIQKGTNIPLLIWNIYVHFHIKTMREVMKLYWNKCLFLSFFQMNKQVL